MQHLSIKFLPASGNHEFMYNYGDIDVVVVSTKSIKPSHPHAITIYNEQLMMMADLYSGNLADEKSLMKCSGRSIKAKLIGKEIWVPGKYFLLVRNCTTEEVSRFDLTLDEHCEMRVTGCRECSKVSVEAVLCGELYIGSSLAWREFSKRPGVRQLRDWAVARAQQNVLNDMRSDEQGTNRMLSFNNNLLVTMHGDDSLILNVNLLARSVAKGRLVKQISCTELDDPTVGPNRYDKLNELFEKDSDAPWEDNSNKKFIIVFYNIGILAGASGKAIIKKLMTYWPREDKSFIFYGTRAEIDALLEQNPSMKEHFPVYNRLAVEPSTLEEIIMLFSRKLRYASLRLSPAATDKLCRLIIEAHKQGLANQWTVKAVNHYVNDNLKPAFCHNVIERMAVNSDSGSPDEVLPEDIDESFFSITQATTDQLLDGFNEIVGLEEIKRNIVTLSNRTRFYQERRQLGLHTSDEAAFHAVFMGNPGTGKTTVAKMLGKIYHSLGILSRGEVISVDRSQMVGEFIGQTEQNMKQILAEAQGNVLFVDEAYNLYKEDCGKDYGRIAVECLLDVLSRKNPDMLIVFAGYEQEMKRLLTMNPGLDGRFPYKFYFPDCTADQLMQIARLILAKDQYILTTAAVALLEKSIREAVSHKDRTFGNARWVGQYVRNGIIPAMADRLTSMVHAFTPEVYQTIEAADIKTAHERFNAGTLQLSQRSVVGFRA